MANIRETHIPLSRILLFYKLVKVGSISEVAEQTDKTPQIICNDLSALEEALGKQLTFKKQKQISLTEDGKNFFKFCKTVYLSYEGILNVDKEQERSLTVSTLHGIARNYFPDILKEMCSLYPETNFSILSGAEYLNFNSSTCDVLIGPSMNSQPDLVKVKLRTFEYGFFATKQYLEAHGVPQDPYNFKGHTLLRYKELDKLPMQTTQTASRTILASYYGALANMSRMDLGICSLPIGGTDQRDFVRLFDNFISESEDIFFQFSKFSSRVKIIEDLLSITQKYFTETFETTRGY